MALRLQGAKLISDVQAQAQQTSPAVSPRCAHCGEVLGVYEHLVHVIDDIPYETSRAAAPQTSPSTAGLLYHAGCFDRS